MKKEIECIWPLAAQLGEGPIWSVREQALWFVDIKGQHIHRFDERTGDKQTWETPEPCGFIAPTTNHKFICGLKSGLYEFDPRTGAFTLIVLVDTHHPHNRLNDGYVDARGRLWFGTMDDNGQHPNGSLYCFVDNKLTHCDPGYVITNGPAVCLAGRTLYHIDTQQQIVYAFDLNADGTLTNRREFIRITETGVYPDGPVVDSAGNIWISMFGGWGVRCYSPQAELLHTINLPVANCTKAAFGGDDLRTLYITTAWGGLSDDQRKQQPLAGGLFRVRVDVPGLPQNEALYQFK